MREIKKSEPRPPQAEESPAEPTDWDEYRQQRLENQTICNQIAEHYPLAYQFLATTGIEVLDHITWDEVAQIDRELQPMACSTWEEQQTRDSYDARLVQRNFPRLTEALDAIAQLDIEDLALNALARAAFDKSTQNPAYVVNKVLQETRREPELYGNHSSDVNRPRSYYGDTKKPLEEPSVRLG